MLDNVFTHLALFVSVMVVTFGMSSLVGHSLKENARHNALKANQRSNAARADVARIRKRVERLSTMRSVDEWSLVRGMVASYKLSGLEKVGEVVPQPKQIVAKIVSKPKVELLVARLGDEPAVR
ncbi:MAG: hypothetical protein JSS66_02555 [Armatimonadetes bacterium]|nr:hypothetical protein [Armatimonadota bacterium]